MGAIIKASETAYQIVKWIGASYLIWMGCKLLITPRKSLTDDSNISQEILIKDALKKGFLTNILNPKVGIFYITFLPQFIPTTASIPLYSFLLAVIHVVLTLIWFSLFISAIIPLGRFFRRPAVIKALDRLTGGIFIGFGLKLIVSKANI